ncbi:hypothetical protein GGR51DRAFT_565302 [Nemania sp. FL0031]|nr:hypothetical protein GGR51DRAFT_565302 [Nemania sp. FL0031]
MDNKNELPQNMDSHQHDDMPMQSSEDEEIIEIPRHETMQSALNEIEIKPRQPFPALPLPRSPVRSKSHSSSQAFTMPGKYSGVKKRRAPLCINTNVSPIRWKPNTFTAPSPGPMSPLSDGTGLVRDGNGAVSFAKNGTKARVTLYGIPIPNGPFKVTRRKPRRKVNYKYITAGVKKYGWDVIRLLTAQVAVTLIMSGGKRFWPSTLEPTFGRLLDIWRTQEATAADEPKKSSGWFSDSS